MRGRIPAETWEQVEIVCASGVGLREIVRNMNISEGTMLSRAKGERLTR
jgi:hypothetical protein